MSKQDSYERLLKVFEKIGVLTMSRTAKSPDLSQLQVQAKVCSSATLEFSECFFRKEE
jgi:hypothetical protein